MNEEVRHLRVSSGGHESLTAAMAWAASTCRKDFADAENIQVVIEQAGVEWTATINGVSTVEGDGS